MKQIALLHYTAPPMIGNTENTIYHHARLLNQAGYSMRVISSVREEAYYQISFRHQVEHLSIEELSPAHPKISQASAALKKGQKPDEFDDLVDELKEKLAKSLEDIQVCIVYNALTSPKNLALTAALHKLAPNNNLHLISWSQEMPEQGQAINDYPWNLVNTAWPRVRYVAARRSLQKRLSSSLGLPVDQVKIMPTGVDTSVFLKWEPITIRLVEHLNLLGAYPMILLPTPIAPQRGIEFAIQTAAGLINNYPKTRLLVAQHPQEKSEISKTYLDRLSNFIKQAGMSDNVSLLHKNSLVDPLPELSRSVLFDLYQLADLLLLPDPSPPSMGIPLLEASLARLPIFTANPFPLPAELDHLVQQFTPQEPAHLAQRMAAYIANDPACQLRRLTLNNFTWQAVLKKHLIPLVENA